MRVVPDRMKAVWLSGKYTGMNRPIARATIQRTHLIVKSGPDRQRYASYLFGNPYAVFELPNLKSVQWQRTVDQDAGTATLVLYNAKAQAIGQAPPEEDFVYNQPGFFTFNRGDDANPWLHNPNHWTHRLYPDMLIKTYEGYGFDPTLGPHEDPNQMSSGVWLIDQVILKPDKTITLKCRDAARLALDQLAFPPVVPMHSYPLSYSWFTEVANPKQPVIDTGGGDHWINPTYHADSGQPYNGLNGSINGHRASDAFDGSNSTYWLSIGNASPTSSYAYEWIEGKIPVSKVAAVRVFTKGGPYRVYVSLHDKDEGWLGKATIPYDPDNPASSPNGADIKYVKSASVAHDKDVTIDVKDRDNIDRVRLTFHDLWDSNYGTYQYRAAVKDVDVLVTTRTTKTTWQSDGTHWEGDYQDYSDIVKWLLAYAGFLWPTDPDVAFQNVVGDSIPMVPPHPDKVLLHLKAWNAAGNAIAGTDLKDYLDSGQPYIGDLWADIEQSGTYGPSPLTTDIFDKKPLMDGISYIRDILGFVFWVDEDGGAQFRSQNIWSRGNNVRHPGHRFTSVATRLDPSNTTSSDDWCVSIRDYETLVDLTATLDSKNIRERIVVANIEGDKGAVTKGFKPYGLPVAGLRRVAIWSDQHFKSSKECQIMADLIAVRQLFTYRGDTIRVPGYPAIQIDDQVKLTEETVEDVNDLTYVKGINCTLDMSTGDYWYDLDTHWLGTEPFAKWVFDPANLSADAQTYLRGLGKIT